MAKFKSKKATAKAAKATAAAEPEKLPEPATEAPAAPEPMSEAEQEAQDAHVPEALCKKNCIDTLDCDCVQSAPAIPAAPEDPILDPVIDDGKVIAGQIGFVMADDPESIDGTLTPEKLEASIIAFDALAKATKDAGAAIVKVTPPATLEAAVCPRCASPCKLVKESKWAVDGKKHKYIRQHRCTKCNRLHTRTEIA